MKNIHKILLLIACQVFLLQGIHAQIENKLSMPVVQTGAGSQAAVPVYLDNVHDIVAVQFRVKFPAGFTLSDTTKMELSDRRVNHTVSVKRLVNNEYLFVIFSANNTPIRGNSGLLLHIPVLVPDTCTDGTVHPFVFSQVILSNKSGNDINSGSTPGAIEIIVRPRPDLFVQDVTLSRQQMAPGENITVSWKVSNIGDLTTSSGWSEQITLEAENGETAVLGIVFYNQLLIPGDMLLRQTEFILSNAPGVDGAVKARVRLIPNAQTGELPAARQNNTALSTQEVDISRLLTLKLNQTRVSENNGSWIQCQLTRSGSRVAGQTFSIVTDKPDRLSVPAEVVLNAGSSGSLFYVHVIDNNILNIDSMVNIAVSGVGYPNVSTGLEIDDNEIPRFTLTPSKTELNEGESFDLLITRELMNGKALKFTLSCDFPKRFTYPASAIIPFDQQSITIPVTVNNDFLPAPVIEAFFSADASGYAKGSTSVILQDNDVPEITLSIAPTTVSESAGYQASIGTIKRVGNTDNVLNVRLSDNSNGVLYYSQNIISLDRGQSEKKFSIGVVDNALVEGSRVFDITAAVYVSSCNCTVAGTGAGNVQMPITVMDDDGPTLKITTSQTMLPEGKVNATILTVTRNTQPDNDLWVTIASDKDQKLEYVPQLLIPAGKISASLEVSVKSNDIAEGDQNVTFYTEAQSYTKGYCWAMISDQTLPDATIDILTLSKETAETMDSLTVTVRVNNPGVAVLTYGKGVDLYLSKEAQWGGSNTLLIHANTAKNIQPNQSEELTLKFKLPDVTGVRYLIAEVNGEQTQRELSFLNNVSAPKSLLMEPKYHVEIQSDKSVYQSGEIVTFSGRAVMKNSGVVSNAGVEIYMINGNNRQTLETTTNNDGNYSISFTPGPAQMGKFIAGACYPDQGLTTEQISFEVLGLRRTSNDYLILEVMTNEPKTGEVEIINPGTTTLTGLTMRMITENPAVEMVYDPIPNLAGGQKVKIRATLTGKAATTIGDYEKLKFEVKSANGASLEFLVYYYCRDPKAALKPNIPSIQTTMTKGTSRNYEFSISNNGSGESGNISVVIPKVSWLSMLTPLSLPSLKSGEKTTVILQLNPGINMAVNVPVTGSIGVNCENGTGFSLPFNIETVSESTGTLVVDVCNEYTYYTSEAPHVEGATVRVRHPYTKALISEGVTPKSGLFTLENLKEGYYFIEVSAPKHDTYSNNVLVDPGKTTKQVVNLSFQSISISWDVVETEVEDEYSIETTVSFETNVPTPVVEMRFPSEIDTEKLLVGESLIFNIILTNKGMITARDAEVTMPTRFSSFTFEPLFNVIDIKPQESVLIPVTLTKIANPHPNNAPQKARSASNDPCDDIIVLIYFWDCGLDRKWHQYPQSINLGKWCFGVPTGTGWNPTGPGGPIGPGGGTGGYYPPSSSDYTPVVSVEDCEPCQNSFLFKMAKCFVTRIPIVEKTLEVIETLGCIQEVVYNGDLSCVAWGYIEDLEWVDKFLGYKDLYEDCIKPLLEPCVPGDFGLNNAPGVNNQNQVVMPSYIAQFQEVLKHVNNMSNSMEEQTMEVFGDSVWLSITGQELATFWNKLFTYTGVIADNADLINFRPAGISEAQYRQFILRWNNTINKNTGDGNFIRFEVINQINALKQAAIDYAKSLGYNSVQEMFIREYAIYEAIANEKSGSVCATITIKFSQTMTLTRQAFRGTLTVFNGHESKPMEEVELNLEITDEAGNVAGSQLFQTNTESVNKLTAIDGTGTLAAQETGTAVILFIPTKNAAPEVPKDYSFGGALSYKDPFTNSVVTRDLYPVTLSVRPSPDLWLSYFMQRDVLGDDALTKDVVEPSVDSEFSLLIHNKGAGEATNVKIASKQPEIVDNEKGLLINFEITGSSLNGAEKNMGITNIDFGNIPAGGTTFGQWFIRSSLLGHFVEYDTKVTHVTSYGNPDLSLVSDVSIHELIRSIDITKDNTLLRGFLANDLVDTYDYPDMLYLSDGTNSPVSTRAQTQWVAVDNQTWRLNVTPVTQGWNYAALNDPGNGQMILKEIIRESDHAVIPLKNIWQTNVTLRDGKEPLYEYRLHFADEVKQAQESYLMKFEVRRDMSLDVVNFAGVPEDVASVAVNKINVLFNRAVDPATFTKDDIVLNCQGAAQDLSGLVITRLSDREFELNIGSATTNNGYYVLTVQTAGISDNDGFTGSFGRTASWIQFLDGKVQLNITIRPLGTGTVTPGIRMFDYGKAVKLTATPATGYMFKNWTSGGNTLTGEREYNHVPTENVSLQANFEPVKYNISISWNQQHGMVTGNSQGIYSYGTTLYLTALPTFEYIFVGWKINGVVVDVTQAIDLLVDTNMSIEAVFSPKDPSDGRNVEGTLQSGLQIYPNPVKNGQGVHIRLNIPEENLSQSRIVIYSLIGAVERIIELTEQELYITDLKRGMYVLSLMTDGKVTERTKVIVE